MIKTPENLDSYEKQGDFRENFNKFIMNDVLAA